MRPSFPVSAAAAAIGLAACQSAPSPPPAPPPDAGATVARAPALSATAARSAAPSMAAPRPTCRAVSLQGDVRVVNDADGGSGPPLAVLGEIPESDWIALGPDARLAAKDPRTTRETLFLGPGRARVCVGHREESWLTSGAFQSETGAGESPGAEEWVVTPLAVLRFSAATLRVEVRGTLAFAEVGGGVVFAWIAPDVHIQRLDAGAETRAGGGSESAISAGGSRGGAWERVTDGSLRLSLPAGTQAPAAARGAVDRCETIAHHAEDLTRSLLAPHGGNGDAGDARAAADAITDEVATRELARAACAVAAVRTGALGKNSARDDLEGRLRSADKAWTALPIAPRGATDGAPSRAAP
jgi:hypothetical protein